MLTRNQLLLSKGLKVKRSNHGKCAKAKYNSLRFMIEFVVAIVVVLLVFTTVIGFSRVDGVSMNPTLQDSQRIVYLRIGNEYEVGDIVAIRMPNGDRYVKRVIALEGDSVELKDGAVYVNGKKLQESYIQGETLPENDRVKYPYIVEKDAVFVLGDNREESIDSREFGAVIKKNVKGRILVH